MKRTYHVNMLSILTNHKHFPKTVSQQEFDYAFFTRLPRRIVAFDFLPSSLKFKKVSYPKEVNKLEDYLSHKSKIFLMNYKFLENLLLVKYLISVAATSNVQVFSKVNLLNKN